MRVFFYVKLVFSIFIVCLISGCVITSGVEFEKARVLLSDQKIKVLWKKGDSKAALYAMTSREKILGTQAYWHRLEIYCGPDTIVLDQYDTGNLIQIENDNYVVYNGLSATSGKKTEISLKLFTESESSDSCLKK